MIRMITKEIEGEETLQVKLLNRNIIILSYTWKQQQQATARRSCDRYCNYYCCRKL